MYRDFFQLDDYPFRLTADARYFFMGEGHARATAYLNYLLHVRDGIGVITGEPGVGKSVVLEHVLAEQKEDVVLARIQQTQLTATEFLMAVCLQFGLDPESNDKAKLIEALYRFCRKTHFGGKFVLLVVDEAQRLKPQVLEEIRLLASLEKNGRKLIHVVLSGQPELNLLLSPQNKDAMSQQVRLNCHIEPLKQDEVSRYIEYRLWIAGGEHTVGFPEELLPLIMRYTGGIPRLINVLCDMTLIAACMRNNRFVDEASMQAALRKLEWPPYVERSGNLPKEYLLPRPGPVHNKNQPRIAVYNRGRIVAEYNLEKERLLIGRESKQDICLDAPKTSRTHAQIVNIDGRYYLQDLNSTNGTYIKKQQVTWHPLDNGDHIRIANYVLVYQEVQDGRANKQSEKIDSVSKTDNS
jgi:general secretion pathway protein A